MWPSASCTGWLADGPLRAGQSWAWWVLTGSGIAGFASFFAYLGYGYLDTWHGLATLGLLPCFVVGLARSFVRGTPRKADWGSWWSAVGMGRACLLATAVGMTAGGLTILTVGMTSVFVPQDFEYLGVGVDELGTLNPRLVPLIAHDRAGFGGAVCCLGLILAGCAWWAEPGRGLWWALVVAGAAGFGAAIGVHPAIGYTDPFHLAPAVGGAGLFVCGLALTRRRMMRSGDVR